MVYFNNGLETLMSTESSCIDGRNSKCTLLRVFCRYAEFQVLKVLQTLWKNKSKVFSQNTSYVGNCKFFNPVIALLLICIIPLAQVGEHQESLLAYLGHTTGGSGLLTLFQSMLFWYYVVLF
jgi:hypothetical protein